MEYIVTPKFGDKVRCTKCEYGFTLTSYPNYGSERIFGCRKHVGSCVTGNPCQCHFSGSEKRFELIDQVTLVTVLDGMPPVRAKGGEVVSYRNVIHGIN